VLIAIVAGVVVGLVAPDVGASLGVLGTLFVNLIKMMISPVIFCTIVLGIGSVRKAASVEKVGGLALAYFLTMSTIALAIGLVVGNLISPGTGLNIQGDPGAGAKLAEQAHGAGGTLEFFENIIPTSPLSSLTEGNVLQTLFVALLVWFGIQAMGSTGEPLLRAVGLIQKLVFRILAGILWLAPIAAFGAMAKVVGDTGFDAMIQMGVLMGAFYLTCVLFVFGVLGLLLRLVSGISIFKLVRYLAREYLLIVSTSSSESALPRLIAKLEHAGVQPTTVGIVVTTGYSFNLDGTAIYLTMASLFIADAMGDPLTIPEQLSLLLFMIVASKGAAGSPGQVWRHWPPDCRVIAPNCWMESD
jgi:aerobic C4-dicarboxylate transport protein